MDMRNIEIDMGLAIVPELHQLLLYFFIFQEGEFIFSDGNALIYTRFVVQVIIFTEIILVEYFVDQFTPFAAKSFFLDDDVAVVAIFPAVVAGYLYVRIGSHDLVDAYGVKNFILPDNDGVGGQYGRVQDVLSDIEPLLQQLFNGVHIAEAYFISGAPVALQQVVTGYLAEFLEQQHNFIERLPDTIVRRGFEAFAAFFVDGGVADDGEDERGFLAHQL